MLGIVLWGLLLAVAACGLLVSVQSWRFQRGVAGEVRRLQALQGEGEPRPAAVETLPPAVRRYLEAAGATRRAPVRSLRRLHGGTFRPEPGKPAHPIRGEQHFRAEPPGFVWWGRVRPAPLLWIDARDTCLAGEGRMLIMVESTLKLEDARGPGLDEGAMLRLLAEMVWYPTALLDSRYVTWEEAGPDQARGTLRIGERAVTALFHFGTDGLVDRLDAARPFGATGEQTPWFGQYGDFREVDGLRVPFRADVGWLLDGKPYDYAHWEMTRFEFDRYEP